MVKIGRSARRGLCDTNIRSQGTSSLNGQNRRKEKKRIFSRRKVSYLRGKSITSNFQEEKVEEKQICLTASMHIF